MPYFFIETRRSYAREYYQRRIDDLRAYNRETARRRRASGKVKIYSKERKSEWTFRRRYGIGIEERRELAVSQGNACGVCQRKFDDDLRNAEVDHDHSVGYGSYRGLLCRQCNRCLGLAGDDPEILRRLALYLEEKTRNKGVN